MKSLFFILLCLCVRSSYSQKVIDVSKTDGSAVAPNFFTVANGEPMVFVKFKELIDGSPYFRDDWMSGNVILNGAQKQYSGISLKLDLYENAVHYRNLNGVEMIATVPIQKVILLDTAAQQIFNFVNGEFIESHSPVHGWYLLLAEGNALLFKQIRKHMAESKPYGSATTEQRISTSAHYFVLYNGNFTEIKKVKDLPGILPEKKNELTDYMNRGNISGKTEDDLQNAINYFNTLH